ncbi:MAG TPA: 2-oxoacid:acceptor oxidoreductase subunit alpha [Syntrophomonas sp.]|nr:2-oxoacid:acceptor oxidoreductase subunit alpha [Syntrophomonas sp.]
MKEISILIGGLTGDGINETGTVISRLFNRLGYYIYMYCDFPSLVKGGHNFAIIRGSDEKIATHSDLVDVVLASNQAAIDLHKRRLKENTLIIFDENEVQVKGITQPTLGLPISQILKEEGGLPGMRHTCMIGGLCKAFGIEWSLCEELLIKHMPSMLEKNLKIARRGFDLAHQYNAMEKIERSIMPVLSGSQAISLGLLQAGLQAYVAYPMTPTSPILEFLAGLAPEFGLQVIPPESEIAVMTMALGYAYMGVKTAVGTSGGGFSLMVEGLGLAGQAELPVVVVMGQRSGPSTGMPTYTAQTDLLFVLHASQGEFPRFIVAPGDAEEACYWSGVALNKAWKYQIPAIILSDRILGLGLYSFDASLVEGLQEEPPVIWNGQGKYQRYKDAADGVSPLAFPPQEGQAIKTNSYVHDEYGITSEEPVVAKGSAEKGLLKERILAQELEDYETVKVYGQGDTALLCWGSTKGVCVEIARKFDLQVIQMLVMSPFPTKALSQAMEGVRKIISVEENATGQLAILLRQHGYHIDEQILKYDGRPFSLEELENDIKKVMA